LDAYISQSARFEPSHSDYPNVLKPGHANLAIGARRIQFAYREIGVPGLPQKLDLSEWWTYSSS